jgi:hypothetical protein
MQLNLSRILVLLSLSICGTMKAKLSNAHEAHIAHKVTNKSIIYFT